MNLAEKLTPRFVFEAAAKAAASQGVPTYVVGGWVRDLLLGRDTKDIDIVCVGDGPALAEAFAKEVGDAEVHIFKSFGTAMVKTRGIEVEFVGARRESYRAESRKPDVEPGTLEDDQRRRDFTINALAISLNAGDYGTLVDPFDGQGDLKRKLLKTPLEPAITFSDDPLRMMRAVRFAAQLDFDIDADAFEAMQAQASRLQIVSMERVMTEFNKILLSPRPSYGIKLAYFGGLLEQFFPELVALSGVENQEGKTHKDNFFHTLEVLDNVCAAGGDLWLRWAALLHDIAKPATKRFDKRAGWTFHGHEDKGARWVPAIFRRLKLPLDQKMKRVQNLVRMHLRPIALSKNEVTDSAVRRLMAEAGEDIEDLMILVRADVTTKNPTKAKRYLANFDAVEEKMAQVEEGDRLRNFQPVLTGDDIMEALSLPPGREVGRIKTEIREGILDGRIKNTWDDCWAEMERLAAGLGMTVKALDPKKIDESQPKTES